MIYAELGRSPLDIQIKSRMIGFWISLVNGNGNKYEKKKKKKKKKKLYDIMYHETITFDFNYKWNDCIKQTLESVGKPDLFNQTFIHYPQAMKVKNAGSLSDLFIQNWNASLDTSNKSKNYATFKQDVDFEMYLDILPRFYYIPIIKFRTANHKLPTETGRWKT